MSDGQKPENLTLALIVGVMGGSQCSKEQAEAAYRVGQQVATQNAVLLCGGGSGVMEAAAKGAAEAGGITVGVLWGGDKSSANRYIRIPIVTNLGDARNPINILSSDLVVAIGGSGGTLSEIALALKNGKEVLGYDTCEPIFSGGHKPNNFIKFNTIEDLCLDLSRRLTSH